MGIFENPFKKVDKDKALNAAIVAGAVVGGLGTGPLAHEIAERLHPEQPKAAATQEMPVQELQKMQTPAGMPPVTINPEAGIATVHMPPPGMEKPVTIDLSQPTHEMKAPE
jgi:hypothetical protein